MSDLYILKDGEPVKAVDVYVWGYWFEGSDAERQVALTTIGDARVSTVFLGLDHNWIEGAPPLLYETMVFGGDLDGDQDRYTTRVQAESGHAEMVARVQAAAESSQPAQEAP